MTTVNCFLEECIHCKDNICTKDTITLDEEHYCIGGCDEDGNFWKKRSESMDKTTEAVLRFLADVISRFDLRDLSLSREECHKLENIAYGDFTDFEEEREA